MERKIIVNGLTYTIGKSDTSTPSHWKGFGGRKWTVRFHDGEILRTDNLWLSYAKPVPPNQDTAVILEGGTADRHSPICGWMNAGENCQVFGPLR